MKTGSFQVTIIYNAEGYTIAWTANSCISPRTLRYYSQICRAIVILISNKSGFSMLQGSSMLCQILKWVTDIAVLKVSMVPCFICWVCGSMICEKLIRWMYVWKIGTCMEVVLKPGCQVQIFPPIAGIRC
jgi:hypothetical protein